MIVDRYARVNVFELVPKLTLEMEPELAALDKLLEDDVLFEGVKRDLSERYPHTARLGRHSTPVEVILRMLIVKKLYGWTYEATEHNVNDSLVLRQFARVYLERVPDDTTLNRWAKQIKPETLERLNEHVVGLARSLSVTRGRKLRTDGTVVETNIAYPTDSKLLSDGVRVISRLVGEAKRFVEEGVGAARQLYRNRTRSAKRLAIRISEEARLRGERAEEVRKGSYWRLVRIAQASLGQAREVREQLGERADEASKRLTEQLDLYERLVERVVAQTKRRVFEGECVPADEKVVSLFERHTAVIKRGRAGKDTEFGRKVWIDEVDGGIVSDYRILEGNPPDEQQLEPALYNHLALFGKPPQVIAGDRGVYSPGNERAAREAGVEQVVLPKKGKKSQRREEYERQGWFRRGMRFRAGAEGRISVLKRRGYLGRCRDKGEQGFGRWVGWGILTANISTIARATAAR